MMGLVPVMIDSVLIIIAFLLAVTMYRPNFSIVLCFSFLLYDTILMLFVISVDRQTHYDIM